MVLANDAIDIDKTSARDDDDMDVGEDSMQDSAKTKFASVKADISEVLQYKDFHSLRSAKLSQDDFLLLLSKFNEAGFHFS